MKRATLIHIVAYTVVAGACFWGGALTRDYLVTREARLRFERPFRFLNRPAPAIESLTVDGAPWSLAAYRGKVVVIDCWASWCGPCIGHVPDAKRLFERFQKHPDFAYVGASLDGDVAKVKAFRQKYDLPWLLLVEPGRDFNAAVPKAFDVQGIPFVCIIDKQGIVRRYDDRSTAEYAGRPEDVIAQLLAAPN